jgi:hypothetical protein
MRHLRESGYSVGSTKYPKYERSPIVKKGVRWILFSILLLAVFSVFLLGCDMMSCDQKPTYQPSGEACSDYCSQDPGCNFSIYNGDTDYCTCDRID